MPTLFRILTKLAIMVAVAYACIWALATFVTPTQSMMTIRLPSIKLDLKKKDAGTAEDGGAQSGQDTPVAGD